MTVLISSMSLIQVCLVVYMLVLVSMTSVVAAGVLHSIGSLILRIISMKI